MPTSDYHQITDVLHVVEQLNPTTVLDVGVGFGKWGVLCREVLEVYQERFSRDAWATRIEGIEIFPSYRNPLWEFGYDAVHVGDALEIIDRLGNYDLILCCDVIEHFDKDEGRRLLQKCLAHGKVVIVTSPKGNAPQGECFGNVHEAHRSAWSRRDFAPVPHLYKDIGFTFMAVLSFRAELLRKVRVLHPLEVLGVKRGLLELCRYALQRARKRLGLRNGGAASDPQTHLADAVASGPSHEPPRS